MAKFEQDKTAPVPSSDRLRNWLAAHLRVDSTHKAEIYRDLIESVTLQDLSYWLQVLFSAGIATLGLILNSPAVIIGAMLISPLMGSILANGLAFAGGDLVLAIRAVVNLCLSCLAAISFAFLLVSLLPFKELTPEIAARTQPTTLDLVIALFSGAVGTISISKKLQGVGTSIPGVAIAVALMPPLCVVGYGMGVAMSLNWVDGIRTATGGGLLFLTNLTAIAFMAMVVFWTMNISTQSVRNRVQEWYQEDPESYFVQTLLEKFTASNRLKKIGAFPSRFILLLIPVLVLLLPLSQSFGQLQHEIAQKQQDNRILHAGTSLWRQNYARFQDGTLRSEIGKFTAQAKDEKLVLYLSVFTSKFYSAEEKQKYTHMLASQLGRSPDSVVLQLTEIPTATSEIIRKLTTAPSVQETKTTTVAEAQATLLEAIKAALQNLKLPPPAVLLDYEVIASPLEPLSFNLHYLSERAISSDAETLLVADIRQDLQLANAKVRFERIAVTLGELTFESDRVELKSIETQLLDRVGRTLQQHSQLQLEITNIIQALEPQDIDRQREQAVRQYLIDRWQIGSDRLLFVREEPLNQTERPRMRFKLSIMQ